MVIKLTNRVKVSINPEAEGWTPVGIEIRLKDGRIYSATEKILRGSPENPMDKEEIINKFKKCVAFVAKPTYSTTYFMIEELFGKIPSSPWIFGVIAPRGTCRNSELLENVLKKSVDEIKEPLGHTWILEKGEVGKERNLRSLLDEMGPKDVFVKGANALDPDKEVNQ